MLDNLDVTSIVIASLSDSYRKMLHQLRLLAYVGPSDVVGSVALLHVSIKLCDVLRPAYAESSRCKRVVVLQSDCFSPRIGTKVIAGPINSS